MNAHIDYVELPGVDLAAAKAFYSAAFGWGFVDYGPHYAGFTDAGLDGGLDGTGDPAARKGPLVILKSSDLEGAHADVLAAGGEIIKAIYPFPGGRRFHFRDPAGNELAVWGE